jgi:glycosyltransferase 2 family protein
LYLVSEIKHRKVAVFILRVVLISLLAAVLFWKVDIPVLIGYLDKRLLQSILLAQPLIVFSFVLVGVRLSYLIGNSSAPFRFALKAVVLGTGLNTVLPGRLSEIVKLSYLKSKLNFQMSACFAAVFLERLTDIIIVGTVGIATLGYVFFELNLIAVFLLPSFAILTVFLIPLLQKRFGFHRLKSNRNALLKFLLLSLEFASGKIKQRAFIKALLIGTAAWSVTYLSVAYFFFLTNEIYIGFGGVLVVLIAVVIGGSVPALPGGFGTFEAAAVFVLSRHGYNYEEALALAISLHLCLISLCFVSALIILLREKIGFLALFKAWYHKTDNVAENLP